MLEQGPDFHFEISEVEITRVDCIYLNDTSSYIELYICPHWRISASCSKTLKSYSMYLDGQAWANSVDPAEMPLNVFLITVNIVYHLSSKFLDTTLGSKLYLFKF